MKKTTRSAGRTHKVDGKELRYALSEWQWRVVIEEASLGGRPPAALADELAERFFHADLVADYLVDLASARHRSDYALGLIQSMLDEGAIDALAVLALVAEASAKATTDRQRRSVNKRHARSRLCMQWVQEKWRTRAPGEFASRDAFVYWCMSNCPGGIDTVHERVRDDWVPAGKAPASGELYRAK